MGSACVAPCSDGCVTLETLSPRRKVCSEGCVCIEEPDLMSTLDKEESYGMLEARYKAAKRLKRDKERTERQGLRPLSVNVMRMDTNEELKITVQPWDNVNRSILKELELDVRWCKAPVTFGNLPVEGWQSWEDAGIDHDANVRVTSVEIKTPRDVWPSVSDAICKLNPGMDRDKVAAAAKFEESGILSSLDLSNMGLRKLPDCFVGCMQIVVGDLLLNSNQMEVLPANFSGMQIGGSLDISYNKLRELPRSFGEIQVDGDLDLSCNQLEELPDSFSTIQVGDEDLGLSNLYLHGNKLTTLPTGFENIMVGGVIWLFDNPVAEDLPVEPM